MQIRAHGDFKQLLRSNFNSLDLIVVNLFGFSTLRETVFSVLDHLWTQDSPICPLIVGGETRPYIDQAGSKLRV